MDISTWKKLFGSRYADRNIRVLDVYNDILYEGGLEGLAEYDHEIIDTIIVSDSTITIIVEDSGE